MHCDVEVDGLLTGAGSSLFPMHLWCSVTPVGELLPAIMLLKLSVLGEKCSGVETGGACDYWLITSGWGLGSKWLRNDSKFPSSVSQMDPSYSHSLGRGSQRVGVLQNWPALQVNITIINILFVNMFCPPEISLFYSPVWTGGGGDSQLGNGYCTRISSYWERDVGLHLSLGMWYQSGV